MLNTSPHFAIIGGGLSGLACLNGIVEALGASRIECPSITIFEPSGIVGPGLAYRIDQPYCWLLNHEADHLGTLNGGEHGFLNWIAANRITLSQEYSQAMDRNWVPRDPTDCLIAVEAKAFYPRSLFGRFLHSCFCEIRKKAKTKGINVKVVAHTVERMGERHDGKIEIFDTRTNTYLFDQAVLTSGHTYAPRNPQWACRTSYINIIYSKDQRKVLGVDWAAEGHIPSHPRHLGTIAVKGTGLSSNDAVLWLLEQRELGCMTFDQIVMASRRGQLRKTRGKTRDHRLKYLTRETLETEVRAKGTLSLDWILLRIRKEMEAVYGGEPLDWRDIWNPRTADIQENLERGVEQ